MQFIKIHWFGLIVSLVVFWYVLLFALVLISPKQDNLERGFIPCTKKLQENINSCTTGNLCVLKHIIKNSACDSGVIISGLNLWIKGEQKNPWANYIFIPEINSEEIDEGLKEFYAEHPNLEEEMQTLKKLNEELENNATEE